jgi:hypothetical protein
MSLALHAVVPAEKAALTRVCGLTLLERALRSLAQAGLTSATVVSSRPDILAQARRIHWSRRSLRVETVLRSCARASAPPAALRVRELRALCAEEGSLYVPADVLCEVRLLAELRAAAPGTILVDSWPPASRAPLLEAAPPARGGWLVGAARVDAAGLAAADPGLPVWQALRQGAREGGARVLDVAAVPAYVPSLRRSIHPLWFPAPAPLRAPLAERLVLDAAQTGVRDLPAKVHAPIETFVIARLCRTAVTPNQLTLLSTASAWAATALFVTGHLGAGLALALAVGILAGLDGKQARVKVETSKAGELEQVSAFLFELSWLSSLAWLFARSSPGVAPLLVLALYLTAALDGTARLKAERWAGKTIDDSRPALRVLRLFAGRRNVYVWILAAGHFAGAATLAYRFLPAWPAATALVRWARLLPGRARRRAAPAPAWTMVPAVPIPGHAEAR